MAEVFVLRGLLSTKPAALKVRRAGYGCCGRRVLGARNRYTGEQLQERADIRHIRSVGMSRYYLLSLSDMQILAAAHVARLLR